MDIKYNKEKLQETLNDVYTLLKTPISIFDRDFRCIVSNARMTEYCTLIRSDPRRHEKCKESDSSACARCRESGKTFSYFCHGNVYETITPIFFEKNLIGYIIFGQYRMDEDDGAVLPYAEDHGMDPEALLSAYQKLPILTKEQVDATCNILKSCILRFSISDAITLRGSELAEKIKTFIEEHPKEKITADLLCRKFHISRQQMYNVFRQNFNTTVKEYILERKLSYAKHLLKNTSRSVTEIAEMSGFPDYNNFIQRFKQREGVTPLKYRKG